MPDVVALLSPGEMGSALGRLLSRAGLQVVTCVEGRSEATRRRAVADGIEALGSLSEVVQRAELVLSVVPPGAAVEVARSVAAACSASASRVVFADLNAVAPETVEAMQLALRASGCDLVDGCLMGGATNLERSGRAYLAGQRAGEVKAVLERAGLRSEIVGPQPGQASALKMLYAGLTKGLAALGAELLTGAEALGVTDTMLALYQQAQPEVLESWRRGLPGMGPRALRRSQEMAELAEMLSRLGVEPELARASERTLRALADSRTLELPLGDLRGWARATLAAGAVDPAQVCASLGGTVAVVTGGGTGLGRAMAHGLAACGARVVVAGQQVETIRACASEIEQAGGQALAVQVDVREAAQVEALFSRAREAFGPLDTLVAAAGLRMEQHDDGVYEAGRCLPRGLAWELPLDEWTEVVEVNLHGVYLCCREALTAMAPRGRGSLITVSSNAGSLGVWGKAAYCASKHGVEGLTRTLALETRGLGIRVNAIHPGGRADVDGRGGQDPRVVVPLALYLASPLSEGVSGRVIAASAWLRRQKAAGRDWGAVASAADS